MPGRAKVTQTSKLLHSGREFGKGQRAGEEGWGREMLKSADSRAIGIKIRVELTCVPGLQGHCAMEILAAPSARR